MPGTFDPWSVVHPKAAIVGLSAALVTSALGAGAFAAARKSVTLSVDGKNQEVSSFANTVGALLEREGVDIGSRDSVAPAPSTQLSDGLRVAVRHGRPLTLTVDQQQRRVWVTALSVGEALDQLSLRGDGAFVSASRSARIPLSGMSFTVRTSKDLTFRADGRRHVVSTAAASVGDALTDAGLRVDGDDRVSVSLGAFPRDGQVIKVTRVEVVTRTRKVVVDYDTVQQYTDSMREGRSRVTASGDDGLRLKKFRVTLVDGKATKRKLVGSRWIDRPNDRIVRVGTRDRVQRVSRSSGSGSIPSSGGLNWAALAECESGGDPTAVNPAGPYYGLYQFSLPTWQSVGGSGLPSQASVAEQTKRAQILYDTAGPGQWPVCGSRL